MRRISTIAGFVILTAAAILLVELKPTKAQDASPSVTGPAVTAPADIIDQMMSLIGQNRIDDATALMGNLKSAPDLRSTAREQLSHLHDDQGSYHGYELAAVQKFSNQFQTFNVMAYYDEQPVLLRFHFYRTQNTGSWNVNGFQAVTNVAEITEVLKDTPIDYPAHRIAK